MDNYQRTLSKDAHNTLREVMESCLTNTPSPAGKFKSTNAISLEVGVSHFSEFFYT